MTAILDGLEEERNPDTLLGWDLPDGAVGGALEIRALDANAESVWLDGLTSVHDISREADGVTAVFTFKNGSERRSSIRAGNRVLYLAGHFGRTEPLDLASVARIEFE